MRTVRIFQIELGINRKKAIQLLRCGRRCSNSWVKISKIKQKTEVAK